jgi:hypothetical protein
MISGQTLRVCPEGKPVPTFPDHAAPIPLKHILERIPKVDRAFTPLPYSITSLARAGTAGETASVSAVPILAASSACVGWIDGAAGSAGKPNRLAWRLPTNIIFA